MTFWHRLMQPFKRSVHSKPRPKTISPSGFSFGSDPVPSSSLSTMSLTTKEQAKIIARKNPIGKRSKKIAKNYTVGTGIRPIITTDDGQIKDQKLETFLLNWASSVDCDYNQIFNLYGLQRQIVGEVFDSGACLVKRHFLNQPVNFCIQVLDIDYLAIHYTDDTKHIRSGIKRINDRTVSVFLKKSLYGTTDLQEVRYEDICIAILDGQPVLESVISTLDDIEDYSFAQRQKQKLASTFTGLIETQQETLSVNEIEAETERYRRLEAGRFELLPAGKKVIFPDNPKVDGYREFMTENKRDIAIGTSTTYEKLTGDYSNVNFSSARMANIDHKLDINEWQEIMLEPQVLQKVGQWMLESAKFMGFQTKGQKISWTMPKFQSHDEHKEVMTLKYAIDSHLMSISEAIRKQGKNPIDVFTEIKEEQELLKKMGIITSEKENADEPK